LLADLKDLLIKTKSKSLQANTHELTL